MTTHALLKLRRTLRAAFYLSVASIIVTPAEAQQQEQPIGKLECEGETRTYGPQARSGTTSGVIIEIDVNSVIIFGLYAFPEFQKGLMLQISSRNQAMIFLQAQKYPLIGGYINRFSGELMLLGDNVSYIAKCSDPKAVF